MWVMNIRSSASNAVLTGPNPSQPLGDVTVNLEVTEDLVTVGDGGFTLQLNAYPIPGPLTKIVGLQLNLLQFTLYVSNVYGNNTAAFQWQAWSSGATTFSQGQPQKTTQADQPVPPFPAAYTQPNPVITQVPNNRLPKGSNLTIKLTTNPSTNLVTQADFTVQVAGQQPVPLFPPLRFPPVIPFTFTNAPPGNGQPGVTTAQFPINGFQVNLVGQGNCANANFISGAGVLSYSVREGSSLSVQDGFPVPAGICETSNILYGPVASPRFPIVGQPPILFQSFSLFRGAKTWLEQAPFGPGHSTPVDGNAIACRGRCQHGLRARQRRQPLARTRAVRPR
jgi:hypothetical protein